MSEIKKIYGIDLGTTYSCIAHIDKNGEPAIIPNAEGDLTTPSVVYIESGENVVVGTVAKQSAEMEPNRVVDFVKRSMGDENFAFEVDGREYKPEEVSSFILRKLVKDASSYLGEPITDVVITCPAYFGIKEREATKNAGKIAELNVHNVLNEPTAAAFSYGLDRAEEDQVVVVYDLGGGTFDVTMIEIKGKDISVITTGGDHHLGGKDWDDRIIEYFATEFMNAHGENQDPRDDLFTMQDLRNKAEEAKKILTAKEKYKTVVSYEGERTEIELTREKFEELTMDLLNRTIELTKTMLEDAKNKGHSQVTTMLLVGGASRMPMVTPKIKSEFGLEPMLYEPDQAIAKGY
jgi:molecular chaperone DnaK (HSP70)